MRDSINLNNDDSNYQMFAGRQTATTKSARNHRFQVQTMRRPVSLAKQRFEHLTPRQRLRKRQELIDRFKSNVTNFIENSESKANLADLNQTQPWPEASDSIEDLLGEALGRPDTFIQRKAQKRRGLRDQHASQSTAAKFHEKKVIYNRGEEQLWDLINRIEKLKDLQKQKDETQYIE